MGIFGRKPSYVESDSTSEGRRKYAEGTEEGGEERTVKVKKIKDLNSGNKKRRKEPVRAWNKFDRIVILLILLLTMGLSLYLAASSRGYKLPDLLRLSIPKINFLGERTIILESNGNK